jgi:hypothetical protein
MAGAARSEIGSSSFLILMAKSEIRATHVWQPIKNLMYHRAGGRENDFTISIKTG